MTEYKDIYYQSPDGLTLYARDYDLNRSDHCILMMHGLSRNSADFADLADILAPNYRLIVVDQRGRGKSEYDSNTGNYNPGVYVQDMFALLDQLNIDKVTLIGTSMGGLMSMIMSAMQPGRINAVVMNDIGPVVNPAGLERIKGYVGKTTPASNWDEAVEQCKVLAAPEFPDFSDEDWLKFAKALYKEDESGCPVLAYDPAISEPMQNDQATAVPPDLWPAFEAMKDIPLLLVRGRTSDILATDCVEEMQRRKPDMQFIELANRGHAPILNEAPAVEAIQNFLNANCQ
jgi:pimeloyl-ACP methyl ester carboxylesterase